MATKKLKHGVKILTYTASDYSGYKWNEAYLHPSIYVRYAKVCDALQEFKQWGYEDSLKRATKLRNATGDTVYIDTIGCCSDREIEIQWQSGREDGRYRDWYACQVKKCGFNLETIALLAKITRAANGHWGTSPETFIAGLKNLGAVCIKWNKEADTTVLCDHPADGWFGLPEDLRPLKIETVAS